MVDSVEKATTNQWSAHCTELNQSPIAIGQRYYQ